MMQAPLITKGGGGGASGFVQSAAEDSFFGPMHHWLGLRPQKLSCCSNCAQWCKSMMGCPYSIPLFITDEPKQKSSEMDGVIEVPCDLRRLLGPCGAIAPCVAPNPVVKIPSRRVTTDTKYICNLCAPNILSLSTPGGARVDVHELPWVFIELYLPGHDQASYRTGLPMECGLPSQGCMHIIDKCNDTFYKTYRRTGLKLRAAAALHEATLHTPVGNFEGDVFAFVDSKYVLPSTICTKLTAPCAMCPKQPAYATDNSEGVEVTTYQVSWTDSLNKNIETNSDLALGTLAMHTTSKEGLGNGTMLYLNPCFCLKYGLCLKFVKENHENFWPDSDNEFEIRKPSATMV